MKAKPIAFVALLACLLALNAPAFAHHGSVAYDNNKLLVFKDAMVTKVHWANPHILVMFDAKDESGAVKHWLFEGGAPSAVSSSGWTMDAVKAGDTVTIYMYQAKNGAQLGRAGKLMLANGKALGGFGEVDPKSAPALGADRPSQCDQDFGPGGSESVACRPDGKKTSNK